MKLFYLFDLFRPRNLVIHSRKDGTTQNVLDAISFDLKFTFVLVGWKGSGHDFRVLNDAFARPGGFSIPEGIIGLLHRLGLLVLINFVRFTKA